MQEYRDDEIIKSSMLPDDDQILKEKLDVIREKLSEGTIDHVRIGRFPDIGESITVNGIQYVVVEHPLRGQFTASISDPRFVDLQKDEAQNMEEPHGVSSNDSSTAGDS